MIVPKKMVDLLRENTKESKIKVCKWFAENTDMFDGTVRVTDVYIKDRFFGEEQVEGQEWCDQREDGWHKDSGFGTYFYKTKYENVYVAFDYVY